MGPFPSPSLPGAQSCRVSGAAACCEGGGLALPRCFFSLTLIDAERTGVSAVSVVSCPILPPRPREGGVFSQSLKGRHRGQLGCESWWPGSKSGNPRAGVRRFNQDLNPAWPPARCPLCLLTHRTGSLQPPQGLWAPKRRVREAHAVLALKPVRTRVTSAGASVGTASAPPTSADPDSF